MPENQKLEKLGRYLLVRRLASGGMAEIFLAKLLGLEGFEKEVVIKRILSQWSSDKDFVSMLIDEAKIVVQLNHPNIIQVYELAREGTVCYIAMEYLHGVDLRRMVQKASSLKKKIPLDVVLTIVTEMLEGLAYAHAKKDSRGLPLSIVHRDISPQNILVSFDGTVKITDFGIAKAASKSHETAVGVLKGKFAYMSPEQANQEEIDARSDLFSAAVVFYELLTGERLFHQGNDIETLDRVRRGQFSFSPTAEKVIPVRLKEILLKALARDKGERFSDATAFREELIAFARRTKKKLRREKVSSFLVPLFAEEIRKEAEEKTRLLTEATLLLSDETKSVLKVQQEEVFVQRDDSAVTLKEIQKSSKSPWVLLGGIAAAFIVVVLFFITLRHQPEKEVQQAPETGPSTMIEEIKKVTPPPEIVPSVTKKQAVSAEIEIPKHSPPPVKSTNSIVSRKDQVRQTSLGEAFLSVQAIPWGYVTIDGVGQRFETPVRKLPLKVGRHTVEVLYEPDGAIASSTVQLETDQEMVCIVNFRQGRAIRCGD